MEWFFVSATWLDVVAISWCTGILACLIWVLPREAPARFHRYLWAGLIGGAFLLTVGSLVLLASRTLEFSGASFSGLHTYLVPVVTKTHYGLVWQVRMLALAGLVLCLPFGMIGKWRRMAVFPALVCVGVVAYTRSATGHAGDHGIYTAAVWVDWAHLLAGGVWVGMLLVTSILLFPSLRRPMENDFQLAADVFTRLSRVAAVALSVIVLTGVYNAWRGLTGPADLWSNPYGQILSFKLLIVGWMVYIGGHNRYHKLPAIRRVVGLPVLPSVWERVPGWRPIDLAQGNRYVLARCASAVRLESGLGLLVLAVAALLHHGMPPADMRHMTWVPAFGRAILSRGTGLL